jgi:hypothetical protein
MEASMNRTVDVGPTRARPGLALLLALLSIPGTTMVWDLDVPVPGLWIGGPLGVAAIVLGVRARRELAGKGPRAMAMTAIVIATLFLAQMVVWTAASVVS